jgi:endoglucanase
MKRYISTITIILACKVCFASVHPVDKHGQLSVEGQNIVDREGHKVLLKGISLGWHNWWPQYYNHSVVEYFSCNWRVSVIRAAMGVEPAGGYLENPEESIDIIKTVIDAAIANGIYLIVDWHAHDIYTEEAKDFFSIIAQQYGRYPNIIYEIFNEPKEGKSWEDIKEYSVRVIESIRRYDSNNLIIVGTSNWSQDVDIAANDPIFGYENIVYSLHFYAASHDYVRFKAASAVRRGLPIFVSECSPSDADGDGKLDKKRFSRWLRFMKQNDIGFVLWGLYDKEESSAMLKPGADNVGDWTWSQLTEMGVYARQIVKGGIAPTKIVSIIGILFIITIAFVLIRKR